MKQLLLTSKISTTLLMLLGLLFSSSYLVAQTQAYSTPGTYTFTVPAGVTSITVSAWGGGGAGGGLVGGNGNARAGGGGEGGSFVRGTVTVTPGTLYTVVVGSGGVASTGSGTAGTASSFGGSSFFNAIGGVGGTGAVNSGRFGAGGAATNSGNVASGTTTSSNYGGNGGTATNASTASSGGGGGSAGSGSGGGNGGVVTAGAAGSGGGVVGAAGRGSVNDGVGLIGGNPGAGGSGARNANNSTNYIGGEGGDGQVTVAWSCAGPDISNFSTTASSACSGNSSTVTVTSTSIVSTGNYNVYYTLSGANVTATAQLATLNFNTTSNVGTFSTIALANSGATTVTLIAVDCAVVSSGNTASITVNLSPTSVTANVSSTSICSGGSVNLTSSATSNSSTVANLLDENFNSTPFVWSTTAAGAGTRNDAWTLRADGYTRSGTTYNSNDATQFYLSDSDVQGNGSTTATTLQSPAFSTVGLTAASLSFYHYYRDYDTSDSAIVEVSTNGTTWTPLSTYTTTQGSSSGFVQVTLNLASYLNQATVSIRFRYVAVWAYYWAVDNVSVTGTYATSPPPTYVWTSTPSGYTSSAQNPTGVSTSGNRSYTVTVTNNYGCTASATTSIVTVNPNVTASVAIAASPSSTICSGTNVTFTATPTNGGTPSYQWKLNGSNVGTNSPTYSNNSLANGNTVSVVMTSTAACVTGSPATSNTVTMTVNNVPTIATVSTPPAICAGTSLNPASPTVTTNGSAVISQSWQIESAVGSNTFNNVTLPYTVTFADNGKKARYIATNGCGTTNGNQVTLTVNAPSTAATISGTTGICSGSTANLQVAITGGLSPYTVVYNGGTLNSYVSNTNIPVSPTSTTSYTITSVTDANGCTGTGNTGTATVTLSSTSSSDGVSWSNGAPTGTVDAILTGASPIVLGANLNACSLTVNGPTVSVASGYNVDLNGALRVTSGSFTLNNNSNLIQHNSGYTNSGNIVVKRNSAAIKRLDYTLWSSPVAGQGLYAFSKFTLPNRFYVYNSSNDTYSNSVGFNLTGLQYPSPLVAPNGVNGTDTANVPFLTGKSYLIRVPYDHPTTATPYAGTFTGVPNTGTITLSSLTSGLYYAIGNPYPSTIDADQFIADNSIGDTLAPGDGLYFWRKTNNAAAASYATYTTAGGVASGGDTSAVPIVPNGVIQVGEGFIVRATSTSIGFNNNQRIANNGNQFLRTNNIERNRIWLNLTDATANVNQMMVSYMTGATQDIDAAIDGRFFMDSPTALNSLLNNEEFAIQGRSLPFEATDVVPLAFKAATAGNFTIAIDHVDGLFTGGAQAIYLKDNMTTTVHNLTTGAYSFATAAGTFNNRFEIVYQPQLANPVFTTNAVVIYSQNNGFVVNSGNFVMSSIKVFDIRGRLIEERKAINANQATINGGLANEVLLVQITTEDGVTVTKKVIK